ncbi:beta-1,4-N-acetylgalactosaminyltransferase bre-4-like [Physella acuta]|uniref:beta-1,4-N-acetylgalactosaminyltransferase bre-4-like n=1 Tax=Physella acuta TaxID=109671 RepID=UPI0027DE7ED3|nr:beta-1,4-N-acetylgalactosaminyltransferase bre-4-like [Physella acuta]
MYSSKFLWPSTKFRRRQFLCLFLIIITTFFIFSLLYTAEKTNKYRRIALGLLSNAVHLNFLAPKTPCSLPLYNSSHGPINADTDTVPGLSELVEELGPNLVPGGHFIPPHCRSQHRVAIIVPFRERQIHLKIFLRHMHPFLQRQNLEYGIFVVEQAEGQLFNRAILMNIGFVESLKLRDYDCFVFHDVDLLPLDDRNYYTCGDHPVHLSASIDVHGNRLMYQNIFGGASMLTRDMMSRVNGFSNVYFGWGGEDDDMSYRVRSHGMLISRYEPWVATYTMMRHAKENQEDRTQLLASSRNRIHKDGLNTLKYKLLDLKLLPLYTWVYVQVNQTQLLDDLNVTLKKSTNRKHDKHD